MLGAALSSIGDGDEEEGVGGERGAQARGQVEERVDARLAKPNSNNPSLPRTPDSPSSPPPHPPVPSSSQHPSPTIQVISTARRLPCFIVLLMFPHVCVSVSVRGVVRAPVPSHKEEVLPGSLRVLPFETLPVLLVFEPSQGS